MIPRIPPGNGVAAVCKPLPREFYLRDAIQVAQELIGKELVHCSSGGITSGVIVETEAYMGVTDPASHAFGGLRSKRTEIMYLPGGRAYVYLIYGMYNCMNVTAQKEGVPECVLIRALQPVRGMEIMQARRGLKNPESLMNLTNGPGKLCQAMEIGADLYGADLCDKRLFVQEAEIPTAGEVGASRRLNIEYAGNARDLEWRFYLKGNPFVTKASFQSEGARGRVTKSQKTR
ncbi:MAG: DNA-3-methyladenine glycosylase [Oryzomonas sp.]|uniref:DNA-3-methyladenine glycosylase n=1 Tax=Oryzomonas sp. TaxID=2855186 RepID=UPI0028501D1E|nr:DNA-3-methyladenine glycosylase [Oryzomonas sp.]MDR3580932.1 DNA-3-methyladenine glycosylase [Oryzomonas sp.]